MSILSKFISTINKSDWDRAFLKNVDLGVMDTVDKKPYTKSELVYICITTISRAISQVPLKIYRHDEGRKSVDETHPVNELLRKPNERLDSYSFKEAIVGHLLLDGHVWVVPLPPKTKHPDSLWIVPRSNMDAEVDGTGRLKYWKYYPKGVASGSNDYIKLFNDEAYSIWLWNPYDSIFGLSPIKAGKISIDSDYKAGIYNQKFFENGAVPGMAIISERNLSPAAIKRLKAEFSSRHEGYQKAHRYAILEGNLKLQQMGISQRDMDFPELRKLNRDTIYQIYGVKKSIVSVTENINHAVAKQERKEWWLGTNIPIMNLIASALTFGLFGSDSEYTIEFDTSQVDALQDDYNIKIRNAERLYKLGFTPNEINEKLNLGFNPAPWRDVVFISNNTIPIGEGFPPTKSESITAVGASQSSIKQKKYRSNKELWSEYIDSINDSQAKILSKLKRVFFEIRVKVLDAIHNDNVDINEILDKEYGYLIESLQPLLVDCLVKGIVSVQQELDDSKLKWSLSDKDVVQFFDEKRELYKKLISGLIKRISNIISSSTDKEIVTSEIKQEFNKNTNRMKKVAWAETMCAFNFGRFYAMGLTDYKLKEWFTPDTCRTHSILNKKRKEVGEPWVSYYGKTLRFPCDHQGNSIDYIDCFCMEMIVKEI